MLGPAECPGLFVEEAQKAPGIFLVLISLLSSPAVRLDGLRVVLRNALALRVAPAQAVLGGWMTYLSSLAVPLDGLCVVLRNALALFVAIA